MALSHASLLTVAEMAEADRLTIAAGTPGLLLMENAGRGVADVLSAVAPGTRVTVLCGPGNNGGDGFVAARLLEERGHAVTVLLLGALEALKGDAAEAARGYVRGEPARVRAMNASALNAPDVVIDAMFGAGLSRPLTGVAAAVVHVLNSAADIPVLAVDVPSGIHGDTGRVMGAAVRARETVTFFRLKPGHLLLPGRTYCGRIRRVDIGIDRRVLETIRPRTFENGPALWRASFPQPTPGGHKYDRGHAVALSGGAVTSGAARLAARGALRVGAGLVTVASPPDAVAAHAAQLNAIMVKPFDGAEGLAAVLADRRKNALVVGPGAGVGPDTMALVEVARRAGVALVVDADGLTSFAEEPAQLFRALGGETVLTPHEGEFARLFPGLLEEAGDKLSATRQAAAKSGAVVLLKGADTVIAEPAGRAAINTNAPPTLATAGAGDVLAGFIVGLMAQGMPAFEAAAAGAWLHGAAAVAFGPGLIAEDLPEALPGVLRALLVPGDEPAVVPPAWTSHGRA